MATPKLLLSKLLRGRSQTLKIISSSCCSSHTDTTLFAQPSNPANPKRIFGLTAPSNVPLHLNSFLCFRYLSTGDSGDSIQPEELSGLISPEVGAALISGAATDGSVGDSILPVRALIYVLDSYHDFSGFPWWVIIASSTLALRITLLPVLVLQLKKLKEIAESFPKLPPPFPPPLSGRSFIDQLSLFHKQRRAIGCPSYLWFLAYVSLQVPCFLLWITTVRRMSLDHHPGFDCGGTLWFQNLTEFPHGVLGPIFPLLIAGLHYINVQVSFRTSPTGKMTGLFGLLAQYYKVYLHILTLPILFSGFCVPQGSLVYWLTNSSTTLIQQLSLNHPDVREKLGLPKKVDPIPTANPEEMDKSGDTQADLLRKQGKIPLEDLSPQELLALSVTKLAKGHKDRAIPLLRLALDKDPDYVRAMVLMGQTLLQNKQLAEAIEYFERAISKLSLIGHPTEVEEIDLLILASQWAGVAHGRNAEGIRHLERVANLKEPEDSKSKAHYYDAFLLLASALSNEGRKDEAAKYLRLAAAYDSSYGVYLEECEKSEAFVSDLVSRRDDY